MNHHTRDVDQLRFHLLHALAAAATTVAAQADLDAVFDNLLPTLYNLEDQYIAYRRRATPRQSGTSPTLRIH